MGKGRVAGWLGMSLWAMAWGTPAQSAPGHHTQGWLVDGHGRALYVYDADTAPGQSACTGPCAVVWPPDMAAAGAKPPRGFGVIVRADGQRQWTWHDRPLYRYTGDAAAEDTRGDGINGTWHLVR